MPNGKQESYHPLRRSIGMYIDHYKKRKKKEEERKKDKDKDKK